MDNEELQKNIDQLLRDVASLKQGLSEQEHRHYTHEHKGTDLTKKLSQGTSVNAYAGFINADGSAAVIPAGWTSGVASHKFTITHNLGTTNYAATATPSNFLAHAETFGYTSSKFDVQIFDASSALEDVTWTFTLVVNA
jgi:hypothetical protein